MPSKLTKPRVKPTPLVRAFRAFGAAHEHLRDVVIDSSDNYVDASGKVVEIRQEREHHKLVYHDQYVVLTTYELCYGLWSASDGSLILGRLWGDGSRARLDLSTLPPLEKT